MTTLLSSKAKVLQAILNTPAQDRYETIIQNYVHTHYSVDRRYDYVIVWEKVCVNEYGSTYGLGIWGQTVIEDMTGDERDEVFGLSDNVLIDAYESVEAYEKYLSTQD